MFANGDGRMKRWLTRSYCGCSVPNPRPRDVPIEPRIKHCALHAAAFEMMLFLSELRLGGSQSLESWRRRADQLCREDLAGTVEAEMREMRKAASHADRVRAFFLDTETAVLRGYVGSSDQWQIACRLCHTALPADDDARILHLRSTHRKEWRALTRI